MVLDNGSEAIVARPSGAAAALPGGLIVNKKGIFKSSQVKSCLELT